MSAPWLSILGVGEDGVEGLSPRAAALLSGAALVAGGARHLALCAPLIRGEAMAWPSPISAAFPALLARRPEPVVVLASGDPFCFGVGGLLAQHVTPAEFVCLPAPSCFSLACARLGWGLQDVATISFCGRPVATLAPLLQPGARVLALSADAATPGEVGRLMQGHGFGASRITVLEALGGPRERIRSDAAASFALTEIDPLNMMAIEVAADAGARPIPLAAGLDDALFDHDGQLTKSHIRAMTLAALAPLQGGLLWDIGCGSGAVAIEWLLRHRANRAIGIERDATRAARAARNAESLGVPSLRLLHGAAPEALAGLPTPDSVFIGGGATHPGVIDTAWNALRPGGRMVVNAVTMETEAMLFAQIGRLGGSLARLGVDRLDAIGSMHGFRPSMTVTQWAATKP
jgi:precorrin-6Y C5,15-methyltransferase (decarboxylating)